MKCVEFDERLWEAAESGTIPDALSRHLAGCAQCREALAGLQAAVRGCHTLHNVPSPRVPGIAELVGRRRQGWFTWQRGFALAACLLLAIAGLVVFRGGQPELSIPVVHKPTPEPVLVQQPSIEAPVQVTPPAVKQPMPTVRRHPHHRRHTPRQQIRVADHPVAPPAADLPVENEEIVLPESVTVVYPSEDAALETGRVAALSDLPVTHDITPVDGSYETVLAQYAEDQIIRIQM